MFCFSILIHMKEDNSLGLQHAYLKGCMMHQHSKPWASVCINTCKSPWYFVFGAKFWSMWVNTCCCCWVASVMSDSVQPHRRQPTRLPCPWDSPGKNTGVGCHFLLQRMKVKSESEVAQSCPTLATPWTAAYQAPPSIGFSRQKYWSGLPLPSLRTIYDLFKLVFIIFTVLASFITSCVQLKCLVCLSGSVSGVLGK